jgi:hypothetical protein
MDFVGGRAQSDYVERTRGLDPARCLVAAVDVGKQAALALVADYHGQLETALATARTQRDALSLRVRVQTAGHYHRTLVARLVAGAHDVVELNPAHVKAARATQRSTLRYSGKGSATRSRPNLPPVTSSTTPARTASTAVCEQPERRTIRFGVGCHGSKSN